MHESLTSRLDESVKECTELFLYEFGDILAMVGDIVFYDTA